MSAPHRILFVCHGNICRSTMAEFVMKDLVSRRGMANAFVIGSAATHDDEIGSPVHHGTRAVLEAQDLFVGMDEANMRDMRRQLGRAAEGRCFKLLEFADSARDVADPWYTGDFNVTYDDVLAGCAGLLAWLDSGAPRS